MAAPVRLYSFEGPFLLIGFWLTCTGLAFAISMGESIWFALVPCAMAFQVVRAFRNFVLLQVSAESIEVAGKTLSVNEVRGFVFAKGTITVSSEHKDYPVSTSYCTSHLLRQFRQRIEELGYESEDSIKVKRETKVFGQVEGE